MMCSSNLNPVTKYTVSIWGQEWLQDCKGNPQQEKAWRLRCLDSLDACDQSTHRSRLFNILHRRKAFRDRHALIMTLPGTAKVSQTIWRMHTIVHSRFHELENASNAFFPAHKASSSPTATSQAPVKSLDVPCMVQKNSDVLHKALTSAPLNTFGVNWNADCPWIRRSKSTYGHDV